MRLIKMIKDNPIMLALRVILCGFAVALIIGMCIPNATLFNIGWIGGLITLFPIFLSLPNKTKESKID